MLPALTPLAEVIAARVRPSSPWAAYSSSAQSSTWAAVASPRCCFGLTGAAPFPASVAPHDAPEGSTGEGSGNLSRSCSNGCPLCFTLNLCRAKSRPHMGISGDGGGPGGPLFGTHGERSNMTGVNNDDHADNEDYLDGGIKPLTPSDPARI